MDMPITVPRASVTRVGRRPEGARHGPLPVPRGGHGGRQGGPGRDADRPGADGHDRDHGQFPPARVLAAPQAPAGRRPTPDGGAFSTPRDRQADRRACDGELERDRLIEESAEAALPLFDAAMREYAYQRNQEIVRGKRGLRRRSLRPSEPAEARLVPIWRAHVAALDGELLDRAAPVFTRLVDRAASRARAGGRRAGRRSHGEPQEACASAGWRWSRGRTRLLPAATSSPHGAAAGPQLFVEPDPELDALAEDAGRSVQPAAPPLEGRSRRAGGLRRRARPRRADAGLDERLDDADPEPGRHAGHRGEHDRSASACWAATWTTWCSASEEIAARGQAASGAPSTWWPTRSAASPISRSGSTASGPPGWV